jgi:serine/threonine-protein kinase
MPRPNGNEPPEPSPLRPELETTTEWSQHAEVHTTQELASDEPAAPPAATATPAPARPLSKPVIKVTTLGDFRMVRKLGEGGMGTVYLARQVSQPRDAAVKVLFKHLAALPTFLQRFEREARLMAQLDHPHLIACYEVGQQYGMHYLAMEYLSGGSLDGWLTRLGKFAFRDAVHVVLACARALEYAHGQNLVHRDIKPDNILLGADGVVKLADLGLAKARDDDNSLTQTGTGAGTPLYVAPEQARDAKRADARSDIYSLGVLFYQLLAGQPPFTGQSLIELLQAKEKGAFLPLRKAASTVPVQLESIVARMMAKDPDQRYQSCTEIVEELSWPGLASPSLTFFSESV